MKSILINLITRKILLKIFPRNEKVFLYKQSAWYDKVPVNPELKHNERCIRAEYKVKLVINKDIVIPDPLTLKSGWIIYLFIYFQFIYRWQILFHRTIRLAFHKQQGLSQTSGAINNIAECCYRWHQIFETEPQFVVLIKVNINQNNQGNMHSIFYTDIANLLSLTQPNFIKHHESEYKQGKAYRHFSCEFVREIYINKLNKETPVCILKCKVIPSQCINSKPWCFGSCSEK